MFCMYQLKGIQSAATNYEIGSIPVGFAPVITVHVATVGHWSVSGQNGNTKFVFTIYPKTGAVGTNRILQVAKYNSTNTGTETVNNTAVWYSKDA